MKKENRPRKDGNQSKHPQDNSAASQRQRLHEALKRKPMSTIEIRRELDILHPAGRVQELRHNYGLNIQTHDYYEETQPGRVHRVAKYVLLSGSHKEDVA